MNREIVERTPAAEAGGGGRDGRVFLAPLRLLASNEVVFVNPLKVVSVSRLHKATRVTLEAGAPLDVPTSLEETVALLTGGVLHDERAG